MAVNDDSVLQLYHERWGHQDKQHIKSIVEKELNIRVKPDFTKICEACIYGKADRLKLRARKKWPQRQDNSSQQTFGDHSMSHLKNTDTLLSLKMTTPNFVTVSS